MNSLSVPICTIAQKNTFKFSVTDEYCKENSKLINSRLRMFLNIYTMYKISVVHFTFLFFFFFLRQLSSWCGSDFTV